jgi:DNA-binding NarL/FixJ family response regulator
MGHAPNEDLTPREREVLELLKLRWRNKEIAESLLIEESTVETHVRNVLRKLGFRTREELWKAMDMR